MHLGQPLVKPFLCLPASIPQHPFAYSADKPVLLRQRDEQARIDKPVIRLVPPNKGFHAKYLACLCRHQRLVEQAQLVVVYCPVQLVGKFVLQHHFLLHVLGTQAILVLPPGLGLVHGDIGVPYQRICILPVERIDCYPDAGRYVDLLVADDKGRPENIDDFVGNLVDILGARNILDHDQELVAAKTRHGVGPAQCPGQFPCDLVNEFISAFMPQCVIYILE